MQYGNLTEAQISRFDEAQSHCVREPSFVVWIEGFGDPTEYVMGIDSEVTLEFPRGRGYLNIGRTILVVNNEDGYFYSNGESKISRNARMKVWAGLDNLNIPVFTGVVHSVEPAGLTDVVVLNCMDYMGLFQEILTQGSQDPNNTAKLLMENFCSLVNIPAPNVASTDETISTYTQPTFEEVTILAALEEVCNSIFYTAYFGEDGTLNAIEREHSIPVDYQFADSNIIDCEAVIDTEVVNDITIEYRENFFSKYEDQASIDAYGRRSRSERTLLLNSTLVSDRTTGSTAEELDYALEAFKFTSANDSAIIDCLHIKMKKNDAHGYITVGIYGDNGGVPGDLLGASQLKTGDSLSTDFSWEIFYFAAPIEISPSTDYWTVIDTSSLNSGTVYVQISKASVTAKHAYYDSGSWSIQNDKQTLHRIRGSVYAQRVAEDTVRFYKAPRERMRITAPAVPQLQLLDEVIVNIRLRERWGRYVIEGRRHIIAPDSYTTVDTLRKVG
ncbi:choice-of-anchor R domain-containing protein [Candidatus Poribacteria bacterium]